MRFSKLLAPVAVVFTAFIAAAAEKAPLSLISVSKIWDAAPHNAFTDLIWYDDQWLCAFREGKAHVSDDGTLRIISSKTTGNWKSWAHVEMEGVDLRDPKICLTPQGEVMLTTAGARRDQKPVPHES